MKTGGQSHEIVSSIFGISVGTVSRWLMIYQEEGLDALCKLAYKGDPGELASLLRSRTNVEINEKEGNAQSVLQNLRRVHRSRQSLLHSPRRLCRRISFSHEG